MEKARDVNPETLHRLFYPVVPVIMCSSYKGRNSAMPVVSYASLSVKPPLVGVSCFPSSFTYKLAVRSGCFSLCILERAYKDSMEFLGTTSGSKSEDKIKSSGLTPVKARKINSVVINESSAVIECIIKKRVRTGDHVLLIGKVLSCYATDKFNEFWGLSYKPILYAGIREGTFTYYLS